MPHAACVRDAWRWLTSIRRESPLEQARHIDLDAGRVEAKNAVSDNTGEDRVACPAGVVDDDRPLGIEDQMRDAREAEIAGKLGRGVDMAS
ncbi:MAG TPA: hypothetical protein VFY53_01550 [Rhodoplanes sp.]|nr:hypothetical protein [Rhodoplanes sp.]